MSVNHNLSCLGGMCGRKEAGILEKGLFRHNVPCVLMPSLVIVDTSLHCRRCLLTGMMEPAYRGKQACEQGF